MPKGYYIHSANGQTSLVQLCDRDGNVIAEIMPKGSPTHRAAVVDMLKAILELTESEPQTNKPAPYGYRIQV